MRKKILTGLLTVSLIFGSFAPVYADIKQPSPDTEKSEISPETDETVIIPDDVPQVEESTDVSDNVPQAEEGSDVTDVAPKTEEGSDVTDNVPQAEESTDVSDDVPQAEEGTDQAADETGTAENGERLYDDQEQTEFVEEDEELTAEDYAFFDFIPKSEEDREDLFAFRGGDALRNLEYEAAGFPSYFDLRNVDIYGDGSVYRSFVTPVKVQNPFGTCWGFAAVSAAESSLIASGLADESVDLSEKHLAYFATSHIEDPSDPQNGEGTYFSGLTSEDLRTSAYRYNAGGVPLIATLLFASGIGPNLEEYFGYMGANGERTVRRVATAYDQDGNPTQWAREPVWYSSDDDWSIPYEYRFSQNYRLKDSYVLPSNYAYNYDEGTTSYSEAGINAIKQQMYKYHRAVSINFCAESYLPGQGTSGKQYMSSHWAHYVDTPQFANHSVTVVGWDDNYPKENFLTEPAGNGAFLIKNSWGSELNEFPNNGYRHWGLLEGQDGVPYDSEAEAVSDRATGYFWISYYDKTLTEPEAFEFDEVSDGSDYVIGQMDFLQTTFFDRFEGEGILSANVFTSPGTLELKEISVMTQTPGTEVSYKVYLLPDDYKDPEDGVLIEEGSGEVFEYGGYHRICLDTPRVLTRNQKYSVIVLQSNDECDYFPIASCTTNKQDEPFYLDAVVNEGESFFYSEGQWYDISDKAIMEELFGRSDMEADNFPIKTYLEYIDYQDGDDNNRFDGYLTVNNWQEGTPGVFGLYCSASKTLTAEFRGINEDIPAGWDPFITWTSSDESVVKVTPKDNDFGEASITGVSEGSAIITIDAGEFGTRLLRINVNKSQVDLIFLKKYQYEYTGGPIEPEIDDVWADDPLDPDKVAHLTEDDYTVEYIDNINVGEGTVIVRGKGLYGGETSTEFTIQPKKVTPVVELSETSYVYDGTVHAPTVTSVKADGKNLARKEYKVIYSNKNSTDAGLYTVKVVLKGNYEGSAAPKYKITKRSVGSAVLSKTSFTYNGKTQKPSVVFKAGDKAIPESEYTVTYLTPNSTNAGAYKVTIKGNDKNTKGTNTRVYHIVQAANTATAETTKVSSSFKQSALAKSAGKVSLPKVTAKFGTPKWKVTEADTKKVLTLSGNNISVKKGAKAGTYKIKVQATVAATRNYKAASTKTVTVTVVVS